MYVATVPNRASPPAVLLRESYRQGGKVKTRTLANLTHWPSAKVEALRRVLRGEALVPPAEALQIERSLPHGHVAAVLGTLHRLGLDRLVCTKRNRDRDLVVAMIVARIVDPQSKLATARGLDAETAGTSLGEALGLGSAEAEELYAAMDWLLPRQTKMERELAARHLEEGTLVLYDVTSSYFEGTKCPLGRRGYSRDGKRDKLQIVYGLLCTHEGCPVAVEVFEGNTSDPKTLANQIAKLRKRFGLHRVVLVGDRGMITTARIEEELRPIAGLDWITALRAPAIRVLAEQGAIQPSLFDERDLAEITSDDYPGERLMVCRNPILAEERARKRDELLAATEKELERIRTATQRAKRRLRGQDKIGLAVGRVLNRFKVGKHFVLEITDEALVYRRDQEKIEAEAALDGIYVIRTSVEEERLDTEATVQAYKGLSVAERAFRSLKTVDLKVRPIHHRLADRVRAHVFLCMLAYYVEWHMRRAWAPLLFDDDDPAGAQAQRSSPVQPAQRSSKAQRKTVTRRTDDDLPVHSFQTLLRDLATVTKNRVCFGGTTGQRTTMVTSPTLLQQRALDLMEVRL
jgi:transposase